MMTDARRKHRVLIRPASDVALRVRRGHVLPGAGRTVRSARRAGAGMVARGCVQAWRAASCASCTREVSPSLV